MLSHFRVWGCPAYVKRLKIDKFGPKFDRCLFIGYPKKAKGYFFYLTTMQKIFVSSRTVFLKKKFLGERANTCKIELDEVQEVEESMYTELDLIGESNLEPLEAPLKRSSRVPHQSNRYYDFLITNIEAIQRLDSQKWLEAMKSEIESMEINSSWTLVDPSERIKLIRCK